MIDMRKLLGAIGKLKLFRLIRGIRIGGMDASLPTESSEDREQMKIFRPDGHVLAENRMHEFETLKAMAVLQSRHDRWKAGGPV